MKHTRAVNRERIVQWLADQDDRFPREKLAITAGVSASLINQMLCGRLPGELSRLKICKVIGVSENELFPVLEDQKEFVFR